MSTLDGEPVRKFTFKPLDSSGRVRLYGHSVLSFEEYLSACLKLEHIAQQAAASRWTTRGIVLGAIPQSSLLSDIGRDVEVTAIPLDKWQPGATYLWCSRNYGSRGKDPEHLQQLEELGARTSAFQRQYMQPESFSEHGTAVLSSFRESGYSLVCHDPAGRWGQTSAIPEEAFVALLRDSFFVEPETARKYLQGAGYSTCWHYVFGLLDSSRQLVATYIVARWPWGFEGTYMIGVPGLRVKAHGAEALMLAANALVAARHGSQSLIYGEANGFNVAPAILAGYEFLPASANSDASRLVNVVVADNPIGDLKRRDAAQDSMRSTSTEADYASYLVATLNSEKTKAFAPAAERLLLA